LAPAERASGRKLRNLIFAALLFALLAFGYQHRDELSGGGLLRRFGFAPQASASTVEPQVSKTEAAPPSVDEPAQRTETPPAPAEEAAPPLDIAAAPLAQPVKAEPATQVTTILDAVALGDSASEAAHGFREAFTKVIAGGMGQPGRKIFADPADTKTAEGGYFDVTMKCDPLADNFVTLKLWGSDFERNSGGAILLYLMEEERMHQVGFRDVQVGEYAPLAWGGVHAAPIPLRFYYTTIPLPLSMTQGRTSVTLRIVGAEVGAKGSPGIYRAYVHLGSYFVPAPGDPQSSQPAPAPIRPAGSTTMAETVALRTALANAQIQAWLAKGEGDPSDLLRAFQEPGSPAYRNPLAIRIAADGFTKSLDETARRYFRNPDDAGGAWGGAFGNQGMMITEMGAANFGSRLEEVVDLGDPAGPAKRRLLWAKMLKASRDSGRFYRQGPTSAQSMLGDKEIYRANRGLQVLASPDAIPEPQAMRYLLEASGLEPWRGSDLKNGGHAFPMGTNYYEVSPAGLTKENGYVSAYGEVYDVVSDYYRTSRDPRLRPQLLKLLKARSYMRYPMVDGDGYRVFQMVGPLDWRAHQAFPIDWAYGERKNRLSVAPVTEDPMAIGFAKQLFADNQGGDLASKQILGWKDSGIRLPMTEGQPDFAWADVDNGLVAIKRGEELTWIEVYWQARGGIHSTGRAFQITPTDARVSHLRINPQFDWNGYWRAQGDQVRWDSKPFQSYLGTVHQAYFNDKYLEGTAPAYAPGSRKEEFVGRASFYSARFGRFLVGINMDKAKAYPLKTPAGFTSAPELITGMRKTGPVTVAPFSAVVLDLGSNVEAAPVPMNPRFISANGIPGGIAVIWNTSGGAATYTVRRASTPAGPYTPIATGIGANYPKKWGFWPSATFLDTTARSGMTYYYEVAGVNAHGESESSPRTPGASRGAASINPLPAPWANVNFAITNGSASYQPNSGTFTLNGGVSGDFAGPSDSGHFLYRPLAGDGVLTARLTALNGSTQAGLMVRKALTANSPFAGIMYASEGARPFKRDQFSENIERMYGEANNLPLPIWLRLQRVGRTYHSWHAPDLNGVAGEWKVAGSFPIDDGVDGVTYLGFMTNRGAPTFDKIDASPFGVSVPAIPGELAAVAGNRKVTLSWVPVSGATSYVVKRAATARGPFTPLVANLGALSFTDVNLIPGTTCFYVIAATNGAGSSRDSAAVSATPHALAAPADLQLTVAGTQATLRWKAAEGAESYAVQRSVDGASWTNVGSNVADTSFTDPSLVVGQSYQFSVVAISGSNFSGRAPVVVAAAVPNAPRLRRADGTDAGMKLAWDGAAGASSYQVSRASTSEGPFSDIATNLTVPTFVDRNLSSGAPAFYRITALNPAGRSAPSNVLKAGWGKGLLGSYFNSQDLSGDVKFQRVDPFILFDWGQNPPRVDMNRDFSVRWTGQLEAPTTDTYTFSGTADDSIKAFIGDKQLIGESIDLVAGQKYDFRVEFRDREGAAFFTLFWESPGTPREHLPTSRLFPPQK
jgi:hypothetical protein